jgi:ribonuclease Z
MKIVLLGTGGPRPDPKRNASTTLIRLRDENILFDAGRGVVNQMVRADVPLNAVNPVFITHHHFDHIGDLYDVALATWMYGRKDPLRIYGPPETRRIVDALLTQVYDKDWQWRSLGEPALGGWRPIVAEDVAPGLVFGDRSLEGQRRCRSPRRRARLAAGIPEAMAVLRIPVRGRRQGSRHQRRYDCL